MDDLEIQDPMIFTWPQLSYLLYIL